MPAALGKSYASGPYDVTLRTIMMCSGAQVLTFQLRHATFGIADMFLLFHEKGAFLGLIFFLNFYNMLFFYVLFILY